MQTKTFSNLKTKIKDKVGFVVSRPAVIGNMKFFRLEADDHRW